MYERIKTCMYVYRYVCRYIDCMYVYRHVCMYRHVYMCNVQCIVGVHLRLVCYCYTADKDMYVPIYMYVQSLYI